MEYLQHLVDMYIFGHFLLQLQIEGAWEENSGATNGGGKTIAHELARSNGAAGPRKVNDLERAFSIAVLFHDIGHLLYPFEAEPTKGLHREEVDLKLGIADIGKALHESGAKTFKNCRCELERGGYFDEESDPELIRWLDYLEKKGTLDHGLIGAWYLDSIYSGIQSRTPDVIKSAVRAILLHNAVTVPIDADYDPCASLLVLCDELIEWKQNRRSISLPISVRNRKVVTGKVGPPYAPRSRFTLIENVCPRPGKKFQARIVLGEGDEYFPVISMQLQPRLELDIPPFFLWLQKAQNLGRLKRSKGRWNPALWIDEEENSPYGGGIDGTRKILQLLSQRTRHPMAQNISRWLCDNDQFERKDRPKKDESAPPSRKGVWLHGRERPIALNDIRIWKSELTAEYEQLLCTLTP